jgi:hypothetical protein
MAKTHIGKTKPQQGSVPALTGAKLEIAGVEIGKTGPNAKTPGLKRYTIDFIIRLPKQFKGSHVRSYPTVGTEDDPRAKKEETWDRTEGGPGQLARLFDKAGVDRPDDDEEWDGVLTGATVVAPITCRAMDDGSMMNGVGLFFNESDDDCPEIGVAEEGKGRGRGAAAAAKKARGRKAEEEEEEETEEEDEDETPKKGKKKADKEEEEEETEEEEDTPKRGRPKGSKNKKKDEDEEEED